MPLVSIMEILLGLLISYCQGKHHSTHIYNIVYLVLKTSEDYDQEYGLSMNAYCHVVYQELFGEWREEGVELKPRTS